jgi:hypothetical protein
VKDFVEYSQLSFQESRGAAAGGSKEYIHDDMKETLDNLIFDMWINKYNGDTE